MKFLSTKRKGTNIFNVFSFLPPNYSLRVCRVPSSAILLIQTHDIRLKLHHVCGSSSSKRSELLLVTPAVKQSWCDAFFASLSSRIAFSGL